MKKAIAFLVAAALVSAAFAEDAAVPVLKLTGQVKTGVEFTGGDTNKTGSTKLWYSDDEDNAYANAFGDGYSSRLRLNGSYNAKDYGIEFRLQQTGDLASAPSVKYAYAWENFFESKVTVKAGNVSDGSLDTAGWEGFGLAYDKANRYGVLALIKPVAGLTLGVDVSAPPTNATTKQTLNELGFGAAYATDTFSVQGGYLLDSDVDDYKAETTKQVANTTTGEITTVTDTAADYDHADDHQFAYFGFSYSGVKNLSATFESKYDGLGAYKDIGVSTLHEELEYAVIDPFKVGVWSYQILRAANGTENTYNFKPYVKYSLNEKATLSGKVFYELNSSGEKDNTTVWFQPGASYAVGKATVGTFYRFTIQNAGDKAECGKKVADHTLQLNVAFTF